MSDVATASEELSARAQIAPATAPVTEPSVKSIRPQGTACDAKPFGNWSIRPSRNGLPADYGSNRDSHSYDNSDNPDTSHRDALTSRRRGTSHCATPASELPPIEIITGPIDPP